MAGVPYHSAQQYIDVLIEQGYKVAIAEQMEDPQRSQGGRLSVKSYRYYAGYSVDSTKPDSENNFLVALDRSGMIMG